AREGDVGPLARIQDARSEDVLAPVGAAALSNIDVGDGHAEVVRKRKILRARVGRPGTAEANRGEKCECRACGPYRVRNVHVGPSSVCYVFVTRTIISDITVTCK